jgi:hypothetical protein
MHGQRGSQTELTVAHEVDHGRCCWPWRCRCSLLLLLRLPRREEEGDVRSVRLIVSALSKLTVIVSASLATVCRHGRTVAAAAQGHTADSLCGRRGPQA